MPISARLRVGVAAAALGAVAIAAFGPASGQERPESILPPGFGEPAAQASPTPRPSFSATAPAPGATVSPDTMVQPLPTASASPTATPSATPTVDPAVLAQYEMPDYARRSLDAVGPVGPREGGLDADLFAQADGHFAEALMRRIAAPLPSRWMSILLRRALATRVATPAGVDGADFAAERAWLLLRMGESVAARAVVQSVDTEDYTPKLFQVAMSAELASGDPAGLCPLADAGATQAPARGWVLARAICTALRGEAAAAKAQMTAIRRRNVATGIDLQLTQKVVGAAPGGGQAVTIEWAGVDRIDDWRFGLAAATGVTIPDPLLASVGPQVRYWYALSPGIGLGDRIAAAEAAAGQGVLSSNALVDLYAAVDAADDMPGVASATASDLRTAYAGGSVDARLAAMRQLWGDATTQPPYARLVLTARAAGRIPARIGLSDADRLVASMLTAGLDRSAARWRMAVPEGGDAWAMITLADPDAGERLNYGVLSRYSGSGDAALKQRLFFAGLAGLGRLAPEDVERAAEALDVRIGASTPWTQAIDRAAANGDQGNVILLAAIGMQTPHWRGVPPAMLYRIVGALHTVGLEGEARMIAAEALARV